MSAVATAPAERRAPRPGTARSALRHRPFRLVWAGTMGSNVGTWMQNVALGALALSVTGSAAEGASFVALIGFVQLGPILLLANVAGLLADRFDRRRILVITNLQQMAFSVLLGLIALGQPSKGALVAVVLCLGVGNAFAGPPLSSYMPALVPREDLGGAVSLFAVQMNLSRVVGPAIGGVLVPWIGFSGVFFVNAATYLFAVLGIVTAPATPVPAKTGEGVLTRLTAGFRVARQDRLVGTVLLTIATFSLVCLPFIGLMPVVARENLELDVKRLPYGLLYACFGLGAATGAMAVGSVLVGIPRQRVLRTSLLGFAALLVAWALLRHPAPGYPLLLALGACYFTATTTLSTALQEHLDDAVRGRVMALYMMGFGGVVPIGLLVGGSIAARVGTTPVMLVGAAWAVLLAFAARLEPRPVRRGLAAHEPEPEAEPV